MQTAATLTLDLHGKTAYQAKVSLDATLRRAGGAYRIRVIHGYRNGSAIRDMLLKEYAAHPQVLSILPGDNPGQTELILRKL